MDNRAEASARDISLLVDRYQDTVFKVALTHCRNRADAEDIVQEVFLSYIKAKPQFADENHEKAWFIRVAINQCKNLTGSFWKRRVGGFTEDIPFEQKEEQDLFSAVMGLPEKYRTVIHLFYYEGYSVKEIGQILKCSETAITTRLNRGRKKLKEILKEEES